MGIKNSVTIITGGTGALGKAVVDKFQKLGARIVAPGANEAKMRKMYGKDSDQFLGIKADLTNENDIRELMAKTVSSFGYPRILIHLVGAYTGGIPIKDTGTDQWDQMMTLNLKTAFYCCKHVLPLMMSGGEGRIITVGARGALHGIGQMAAYTVSKAALLNFTEALAAEGRPHGITANCILPSIIDTEANRAAMPDSDFTAWVSPETIASTIAFLCSNDAKNTSAAAIPVYGGS